MATHERRRKLTIEDVNVYWRALKEGTEKPGLQRLCNAIRTLDLALNETDAALCSRLSANAWSRERDDCFDFLLCSFPGYFVVFAEGSSAPLEAESAWPEKGVLEFYPEMGRRRDDAFRADLEKIHSALVVRLRWCFADGRQYTTPEDFNSFSGCCFIHNDDEEEAEEARLVLEQVYESCADEALKLKKIAHRKWWQLQAEAISCKDRRQKHQLLKRMEQLELLWGPSSSHQLSAS